MSAELFHVFIRPNPGVNSADIEKKLSLALDWIKYTDNCYLIYSSKDIGIWNERLKPLSNKGGNLLILDIDPYQFKGWMPKSLWTWLQDKRMKME